jgi:hypothetical protein
VSALATVARVVITEGEMPSCRTCRRSQFNARTEALACTEKRVTHIGHDAVIALKHRLTEEGYERRCEEVAHRCKFYQEEQ